MLRLSLLAIFTTLLTTILAASKPHPVTIALYTGHSCHKADRAAVCSHIAPRTCCAFPTSKLSYISTYISHKPLSADFGVFKSFNKKGYCAQGTYYVVSSSAFCIGAPGNVKFKGAAWYPVKKSEQTALERGGEREECEKTQMPDLGIVDGRAFNLTGMSRERVVLFADLMAEDGEDLEVPAWLVSFEIEMPGDLVLGG